MKIPGEAVALLILVLVGALGGTVIAVRAVQAPDTPDFVVPTSDNSTFRLSDHRGEVVVVEFFATTCAPCRIVEREMKQAAATWNESQVQIVSIGVWPSDTIDALRTYRAAHNLTWVIAQNADQANVKFNVFDIPHVVVVDAAGHAVWKSKSASITAPEIESKVAAAQQGRLAQVGIVQYGLLGLAMVAGAAAFFSPCAVGMLPAYVAHAVRTRPGGTGSGAARTLAVGLWAALGVLLMFFGIGGVALLVGPYLTEYVPYLQPLVGFLLIAFGILLAVRPFSVVVQRLTAPLTKWAGEQQEQAQGPRSFFAYGLGYGAAAAGCTTPVLLSVLVTAAAYGPLLGSGIVAAYALTGAFFMVLLTVAAATFRVSLGARIVRYSRPIEVVSALLFVLGGVFLVWYASRAGTFAA